MKALVLAALAAGLGLGAVLSLPDRPAPFAPVETVPVPAGRIAWTPLGSFSYQGLARTPRPVSLTVPGFEIMKYQVTRAQYAACVAEGGCQPVPATGGDLPQTQVNWLDATAFAAWYSDRTGQRWRRPSEAEGQRAAAERWGETAADADAGALDPGERLLTRYERGLLLRGTVTARLQPAGAFGENTLGLADMAGNVWEWTDGCVVNGELDADGTIAETDPYCGVRIAGGLHRAAVVDFVRDASVGGCAAGLPPDHLGFRLVRENGPKRPAR